uniref:Kit ligand n=1 Tax=Amazona collaria TaxID=241587 RepID=A0A8B9FFK7_9PSIT
MGLCGKPVKHKEQQKTWIITCFCLQLLLLNPLVKAQSSCGNPVTDDVNDITKLVGNLPNDYMITLKYVPKMDSLPSQCWLHLMVPEFSRSLHNLLQKFSDISDMSDVLSNYSIINNLTRIINDLMACLAFDKNKDFVKENGHLYEEGRFIPEDFFRHFNNTIEVYKEFADILDKNDCILPSTVKTPENDSRVAVTKTFLFPPVAASSLRNDSIDSNTSSNKEALGFISSSSLQGISIALTSLLSLLMGFILGAIYWKKTHPKSRPESGETTQCHDCQEENEIRYVVSLYIHIYRCKFIFMAEINFLKVSLQL